MESKATLRVHFQAVRNQITAADRQQYNQQITRHLLRHHLYKNAARVLCYGAMGAEVETATIIAASLSVGKEVCLPRLSGKKGHMDIVPITKIDQLISGTFGIPEPMTDCPATQDYAFDLILIPGLAFDRTGHRLGYGGGYYDRFLANPNTHGYRLALGFHQQLVDHLPTEAFDQLINGIITENGFSALPL